jgi:hypothetical protein
LAFIRVIGGKGFDLPMTAMSRDDGDLGDPIPPLWLKACSVLLCALCGKNRKLSVPRRSQKWYKSSFFEKMDI